MFNLNEEVIKWRNALAQSEAFGGADIDELEGHLREEIERLAAAGLSEQEAFLVAGRRLGDTRSLENEFAKVNGRYILRNRLFWMVAGLFAYLVATCLAEAFGNAGAFIAGLAGLGVYSASAVGIGAGALAYVVTLLPACLACKPNSKLSRFDRFTGSLRGKLVLFASLFVIVIALSGTTILFGVLIARTTSAEAIGRMSLVSAYVRLILPIFLPVVLMVVLVKLRLSNLRATCR